MFNPNKGVELSNLKNRFVDGCNTDKLFPLNPKSSVMKLILNELMIIDKKTNRYKNCWDRTYLGLYIVGTSGIGKSSCVLTLKIITDLRVKHILKHGCPSDSIF